MKKGVIVKGRARSGGRQLASYLLTQGENEHIEILSVDGQAQFDKHQFIDLLGDFSLTEKITRSRAGIYHCTINPPEEIARSMTKAQWLKAAEIAMEGLGFGGQRMASVLHQKKGRRHLHLAIERTNLETHKAIPISHNYAKHLKIGHRLAQIYGLQPLPQRNPNRGAMKEALTKVWNETTSAATFIKQIKQQGYLIAKGYEKPFLVVDETGQSFNLVRHLDKIKTKEVRERFKGTVLMNEREAIAFVSNQLSLTQQQPHHSINEEKQAFLETLKNTRKQQTQKLKMK
ncbi:MAG: relaxase/mobilization nuclease domain-containing protein [Chitinophagales bacterium]|nr:relaxase/mobilization nuclease domain-containing protein [Chitinophagales bacterium]